MSVSRHFSLLESHEASAAHSIGEPVGNSKTLASHTDEARTVTAREVHCQRELPDTWRSMLLCATRERHQSYPFNLITGSTRRRRLAHAVDELEAEDLGACEFAVLEIDLASLIDLPLTRGDSKAALATGAYSPGLHDRWQRPALGHDGCSPSQEGPPTCVVPLRAHGDGLEPLTVVD